MLVLCNPPTKIVSRRDREPAAGQPLADARVVEDLGQGAGIRPAPAAAAGAAIVGRLVRVVHARRAVAEDQDERGKPRGQTDLLENLLRDGGHLVERETRCPSSGPGSGRSAPAAGGSGELTKVPNRRRICEVSRGKRVRATSGIEARTPTAACEHRAEGQGAAAGVEAVGGDPQQPAASRRALGDRARAGR